MSFGLTSRDPATLKSPYMITELPDALVMNLYTEDSGKLLEHGRDAGQCCPLHLEAGDTVALSWCEDGMRLHKNGNVFFIWTHCGIAPAQDSEDPAPERRRERRKSTTLSSDPSVNGPLWAVLEMQWVMKIDIIEEFPISMKIKFIYNFNLSLLDIFFAHFLTIEYDQTC